MGKSEILMLLAGVALSIMLAMVAVPMFSSGNEMADRQQVQQDLMSIKSSIPLILALEGNTEGNFNSTNIKKHVTGFSEDAAPATGHNGIIVNTKNKDIVGKETTYQIIDGGVNTMVSVAINSSDSGVDLSKITRMESICDGDTTAAYIASLKTLANGSNVNTFTCKMKR